ncbi:MAG: PP0621 family protein [Rhodocyclaceae bacterium]|nr:PP0621 family protein [Rhodocyclaceae bacterium]
MAKIFLLTLALLLVYWIFSSRRKGQPPANNEKPATAAEKIVVCAHCQLRVPESEAVVFEGLHYCCEDHRRLGAS